MFNQIIPQSYPWTWYLISILETVVRYSLKPVLFRRRFMLNAAEIRGGARVLVEEWEIVEHFQTLWLAAISCIDHWTTQHQPVYHWEWWSAHDSLARLLDKAEPIFEKSQETRKRVACKSFWSVFEALAWKGLWDFLAPLGVSLIIELFSVDVNRGLRDQSGNVEKVINIYGTPESCSKACIKILEVVQREAAKDPANEGKT